MGFSTSGAVLVILVGFLVAVSVIVPTVFSVGAETGAAFDAQSDQLRDQQNTDIAIESFEFTDSSTDADTDDDTDAVVNVTNEGASSLSVTETDVVVNGHYYQTRGADAATTIVDGDAEREESDVWAPGTHLEIEVDEDDERIDDSDEFTITDDADENSVRITTERGIAATAAIAAP